MEFLGNHDGKFGTRGRTLQPQTPEKKEEVKPPKSDDASSEGDETKKKAGGTPPTPSTYEAIDLPLSTDPDKNPGKSLLKTAILAKLTGNHVGDAVGNYVLSVAERELTKKKANVVSAPVKPPKNDGAP